MEAKDTVMTLEQLYNAKAYAYNKAEGDEDERELQGDEGIALAQAEISFKAGEASAYDRAFIKGQSDGLSTGRKQGIKEVVEWINDTDIMIMLSPWNRKEWKAKLKEWGIE